MAITLTPQQQEGLDKVKAWYTAQHEERDNPTPYPYDRLTPFRWFGYAGTGKTFTAARIPEALGLRNVVFGTYTGKAASVLRKSLARYGVTAPVTTIHSAIYKPTTSKAAREALDSARGELSQLMELKDSLDKLPELDRMGLVVDSGWADLMEFSGALSEVAESIPGLEANARRLRFEFNPESEWADADLIILDEVSMVNSKLAADIESFGVPVLVLGDPAQLPPVEGGGHYTDAEPDHLLTEVLRAALDSPVTSLATAIRQSRGTSVGLAAENLATPSIAAAEKADVVLVWTNKRRWAMIHAIRKKRFNLQATSNALTMPIPGDTIMVLTNNKDAAVFNGELFQVGAVTPDSLGYRLAAVGDNDQERELLVYREGFLGQEEQARAKNSGLGMRKDRVLATFGQAITVHKAQGSEWPHVYVVNEIPGMITMAGKREGQAAALAQARAWCYTACTRASEKVTITRPKG
jgi:exodeoxyribonuclease-5